MQAEGCKESLRKEPKEFRADLVNPKKLRTHLKKQAGLWGRCLGGECKAALSDAESGCKPSARDARDLAGARSKDESIKSGLGRLDNRRRGVSATLLEAARSAWLTLRGLRSNGLGTSERGGREGADRQCFFGPSSSHGLLPGQLGPADKACGVLSAEASEGCFLACDAGHRCRAISARGIGPRRVFASGLRGEAGSLRDTAAEGRGRASCVSGGRSLCAFGIFSQGFTWAIESGEHSFAGRYDRGSAHPGRCFGCRGGLDSFCSGRSGLHGWGPQRVRHCRERAGRRCPAWVRFRRRAWRDCSFEESGCRAGTAASATTCGPRNCSGPSGGRPGTFSPTQAQWLAILFLQPIWPSFAMLPADLRPGLLSTSASRGSPSSPRPTTCLPRSRPALEKSHSCL